jgi:multisubunit Na+/H+ antiporter MnhB subunit
VFYLILAFGVILFREQSRHMSSSIDTLNSISLKIPIYVGFTELVVALVGNGLTIIIFRKNPLRSTRTAPCIMILAIMNIIYLTLGLLTRGIASLRNQFDTTFGNDILCRFRSFIAYTCITIIMSLLSWIAFDR